jgi:6-phosphogluconolactonase
MKNSVSLIFVAALALGVILPIRAAAQDAGEGNRASAVFVMTNSAEKNEVIAFTRTAEGTLEESGRFATGGRGSGGNTDPLESQGSLTLSQNHQLLFAVNAGNGEISVFRVLGTTLALVDRVSSGGSEPNAIAEHGGLVYVLNTGGSSGVTGFFLNGNHLAQIPNSTRFLSTNTSGAASIAFSPDGRFLAVTERLTNKIDLFLVQSDGTLLPVVENTSAGPGAFSVAFAPNGAAIVSETGPGGVPNGSAITSYAVQANGTLSAISTSGLWERRTAGTRLLRTGGTCMCRTPALQQFPVLRLGRMER